MYVSIHDVHLMQGGNPLYKKASQEIDNPLYTMINTEAQ